MAFDSALFIFAAGPALVLTFSFLPDCARNLYFFVSGAALYAWAEPRYFFVALAGALVDHALVLGMVRLRAPLRRLRGRTAAPS